MKLLKTFHSFYAIMSKNDLSERKVESVKKVRRGFKLTLILICLLLLLILLGIVLILVGALCKKK